MKGTISIRRLRVYGRHGVDPQERRVGNIFEVTADLRCNIERAAATDEVENAVNYAEVAAEIERVMHEPRNLLETVAADIVDALCRRWPQITGGAVTVDKVHPPFSQPVESVGVTLEW